MNGNIISCRVIMQFLNNIVCYPCETYCFNLFIKSLLSPTG